MISVQAQQLGEALVAAKLLTPAQLHDLIVAAEQGKSQSLIIGLLSHGYLTFKTFEKFASQNLGIKSAMIINHTVDPKLVKLISLATIQLRMVYPLATREGKDGRELALGMVDPLDSLLIKEIEKKINLKIVPILISLPDFKDAVAKLGPSGSGTPAPDFSQRHTSFDSKNVAPNITIEEFRDNVEIERFTRGSDTSTNLGNAQDTLDNLTSGGHTAVSARPPSPPPPPVNGIPPGLSTSKSMGSSAPRSPDLGVAQTATRTVQPKPQMTRAIDLSDKSLARGGNVATETFLGSNQKKFKEEIIVHLDLQPEDIKHLTSDNYTRENLPEQLKNMNAQTLKNVYGSLAPEEKIEALANTLIKAGLIEKIDLFINGALSKAFKEDKK